MRSEDEKFIEGISERLRRSAYAKDAAYIRQRIEGQVERGEYGEACAGAAGLVEARLYEECRKLVTPRARVVEVEVRDGVARWQALWLPQVDFSGGARCKGWG
jgi:hypothetical protein